MGNQYTEVHKSPSGSGDARPTAIKILENEDLIGKLSGTVVFITGCSSGIGIETAKAFFQTGATLYLTARDLNRAKTALGEELISSPRVHLLELDLGSLKSVRNCAKEFLSQDTKLDIFIANAGVMFTPEGQTEDGFETQLGTNHLSHFLLINLLLPSLLDHSPTNNRASRAIFVSSTSHRSSPFPDFSNLNLTGAYNPWIAYAQSKLFETWTANVIDRRYSGRGLRSWSLQPGNIDSTNLGQYLSPEARAGYMADDSIRNSLKSAPQGAATTVWAATAKELEGFGGGYLENCQWVGKWDGEQTWGVGHGELAFHEEGEEKMWVVSEKLVGLKEE